MLDFLVIGSGPVGAAIGRTLRRAGKEFRILSPEESLFSEWDRKSSNTGMKYLRSPIAHDLSLYRDFTLEDYIRTHHSSRASPEPAISSLPGFINPLFRQRARTDIWNAYCADFARRFSLEQEVLRGQAQAIYRTGRRFLVETDAGQIDARNLALCLGTVSAPRWPAWARSLRQQGADVAHLFDPGFRSSQGPTMGKGSLWSAAGSAQGRQRISRLRTAPAPCSSRASRSRSRRSTATPHGRR